MIVGRNFEIAKLNQLYDSDRAEFIAIYGRRRVGKTYLVNESYGNRITFHHSGLSPIETGCGQNQLKKQLQQFYYSLLMQGMNRNHCPKSWLEAFFMLEQFLQKKDTGERQVVFLDELPWMDTPRSGFITALESFWNGWASRRDNLLLVVCGSASSWILDNLINNRGGLYGRVTYEMKLSPFSLAECEEFYRERQCKMSRYDIVQSYMIVGGMPYYINYMERNKSLAQNVDRLFFQSNGILRDEYNRLFDSAFENPTIMRRIVEFLATRRKGYTRVEIAENVGMQDCGKFSSLLRALVTSDFIERYVPFGHSKREEHYKLIDPFCWFYLHFIKNQTALHPQFWQQNCTDPIITAWRGLAFEQVCFNHIGQIKHALQIAGIQSEHSAWAIQGDETKDGAQVDLLIRRKDKVLNLCEMKFYQDEYAMDKEDDMKLRHRITSLQPLLRRTEIVHPILLTTFGLRHNQYSGAYIQALTLDDLFEK